MGSAAAFMRGFAHPGRRVSFGQFFFAPEASTANDAVLHPGLAVLLQLRPRMASERGVDAASPLDSQGSVRFQQDAPMSENIEAA